ncbi:hypothetical protein ABPG74_022130 [Tetrahymena malaccensis]
MRITRMVKLLSIFLEELLDHFQKNNFFFSLLVQQPQKIEKDGKQPQLTDIFQNKISPKNQAQFTKIKNFSKKQYKKQFSVPQARIIKTLNNIKYKQGKMSSMDYQKGNKTYKTIIFNLYPQNQRQKKVKQDILNTLKDYQYNISSH